MPLLLQEQHQALMNSNILQSTSTARRIQPPQLPVFRRHIVVDHKRKVIYIEVMANPITKSFNTQEFTDIKLGSWYKHVPADHITPIRECIASGFVIEPMCTIGQENEDFRVIQIVELEPAKRDLNNNF